ncbi:MAG: antibiotic biosynthesis monooxygenase [Pseudomonadota bacterium]
MYIAMNRFRVLPDHSEAFEEVWRNRDSSLSQVPGFVSFSLLKGAEAEDHILYASHTTWESHEAFVAWTKSEHFRNAHRGASNNRPMYQGHPEFEGFEAVLDA